ncbi:hypothetical protein [[Clostridium] fimetarium]|uniref:Uncharacterized protein n=1 Tax=[Clostridium] fimetarium TaxID=99656 RepID=A0A1I0NLU6_9FIRM|nr:hypothetical protein [[Clostridium] fimetarium]SEW02150.1 hypothetical protein SAMN05421659_103198 [[Clostridium] fimetarium]
MGNSGMNSKNAADEANSNATSDGIEKSASNKSASNKGASNKSAVNGANNSFKGNGNSTMNVSKGSTK